MRKKVRFFALFVAVFFLFGINQVLATTNLSKGGSSFDDAVSVAPGKYITDHEIAAATYEFYKIEVKAGQLLTIKFMTITSAYAGATIFDADKVEVAKEVSIAEVNSAKTIMWAPQETGILYLSIGNEYDVNVMGAEYEITVKDNFDASTNIDAGDSTNKAIPISFNKTYTGYLAGKLGTDTEDYYKLDTKKGDNISIKIVPEKKAALDLNLFNSKGENIDWVLSGSEAESVSYKGTIEEGGSLFAAISCDFVCSDLPITYTLTASKDKTTKEDAANVKDKDQDQGNDAAATDKKSETKKKGFFSLLPLWAWILIGMGLILIIILILYLIFRKKKPAEPEYTSGSKGAPESIVGYKHPCRYCNQLIPGDSNVCPACGKASPLGPLRCPKCHNPVQKEWQKCNTCNLPLQTTCMHCGKTTFFGDYCERCDKELKVICKHCDTKQPLISDRCKHCGRKM